MRPANRLTRRDYERLHEGIIEALRMGIEGRGSSLGTTLRDHVNLDGDPGTNQETVKAYGREGEPCLNKCGGLMRRIKVGGRSSVFCPKCQPAPRARRSSRRSNARVAGATGRPKRPRKPRLLARPAL
jgi:formamidopyrimidine-DNA glycosylase